VNSVLKKYMKNTKTKFKINKKQKQIDRKKQKINKKLKQNKTKTKNLITVKHIFKVFKHI